MKRLAMLAGVFLAVFLFCIPISNAGTLKIQSWANMFNNGADIKPAFGLNFYQKIMKGAAMNIWSGYGEVPLFEQTMGDDVAWYTTRAEAHVYFGNFTLAPGFAYQYNVGETVRGGEFKQTRQFGYIKLEYKVF